MINMMMDLKINKLFKIWLSLSYIIFNSHGIYGGCTTTNLCQYLFMKSFKLIGMGTWCFRSVVFYYYFAISLKLRNVKDLLIAYDLRTVNLNPILLYRFLAFFKALPAVYSMICFSNKTKMPLISLVSFLAASDVKIDGVIMPSTMSVWTWNFIFKLLPSKQIIVLIFKSIRT